jgi:hypothetical protein
MTVSVIHCILFMGNLLLKENVSYYVLNRIFVILKDKDQDLTMMNRILKMNTLDVGSELMKVVIVGDLVITLLWNSLIFAMTQKVLFGLKIVEKLDRKQIHQ